MTTTYTWDAENRLNAAEGAGTSTIYDYDYSGIRVSQNVNGVETRFLFRIQFQKGRRTGWRALFDERYKNEPQCKGKTGRLVKLSCDEYPYNSTAPGGLLAYDLHHVLLKPVDSKKQDTQSGWLNKSFYEKAGIVPFDIQK